ncbi:hypothetical protein S83_066817, partial [Arachis hypogaea]
IRKETFGGVSNDLGAGWIIVVGDEELNLGLDECVLTELKKAIMQARMDKKLTQAQLAQ